MKMEKKQIPIAKVEIEGSAWNWFFVCEECHYIVRTGAEKCDGCGAKLDWGWKDDLSDMRSGTEQDGDQGREGREEGPESDQA